VLAVEQLWSLSPKSCDVQRRRSSFGSQAALYHAVRPGYPTDLVEWLVGDPPKTVVDLGAGTGVLTQQLMALGHNVVGVEPDELMRAHAESIGLLLRDGSAETVPVADRAADAVVVGQAWHWFDKRAAVREVGRILRPGGHLGLLWNLRDESESWVAELGEIVRGEDRTSVDGADVPPTLDELGAPIVRRARHSQSLTTGQILELVGTWSFVSQHVDRSQVLARVEALLARRERDEGISAHVLPYICVAARYASS
jgi:SAM-dependent methyltransferase